MQAGAAALARLVVAEALTHTKAACTHLILLTQGGAQQDGGLLTMEGHWCEELGLAEEGQEGGGRGGEATGSESDEGEGWELSPMVVMAQGAGGGVRGGGHRGLMLPDSVPPIRMHPLGKGVAKISKVLGLTPGIGSTHSASWGQGAGPVIAHQVSSLLAAQQPARTQASSLHALPPAASLPAYPTVPAGGACRAPSELPVGSGMAVLPTAERQDEE